MINVLVRSLGGLCILATFATAQDVPVPVPIAEESSRYANAIEAHMDYVTENSLDELGDEHTGMWLATIDIKTNGLPDIPLPKRLRWYRKITSPGGANLYWDQPTIVAAHELSRRTGCKCYTDAANRYIKAYLDRCVDSTSGLISWGNHRYYDVLTDSVVGFTGGYHECRPHTPAWQSLWAVDPDVTERAIRSMARAHIKEADTGKFCRHAKVNVAAGKFTDQEVEFAMPFLEAGATLIESLCWLAKKQGDPDGSLAKQALRVARYSFARRNKRTGLVRNQPVKKRWDYDASTTELGLWAGSLMRASEYTGINEFQEIAEAAMKSWLKRGFDTNAGMYFGSLSVENAKPRIPDQPRGYMPPAYADVFDLHERPTHNYPMPMAETCLTLYEKTNEDLYRKASLRWISHVRKSLPANGSKGAYAEDYGRVIHFLQRASQVLQLPAAHDAAVEVAEEAMEQLYVPRMGMFRSHPGEDRCDSVDGPGILILAFMALDGRDPTLETAFHF